ncbi:hypothetical protein BJY00DRAFT_317462 [Aspergillus carlsbadensis]|nr:hypothetical protein BJY00DRAFT_317462 [Aspergillus carlsbadensis]
MLNDQTNDLWASDSTDHAVRNVLGRHDGPFKLKVRRIAKAIHKLARYLELPDKDAATFLRELVLRYEETTDNKSGRGKYRLHKALIFAVRNADIEAELSRLVKDIEDIDGWATEQQTRATVPPDGPRIRFTDPIEQIRQNAAETYHSLASLCCITNEHEIHLLMEHRIHRDRRDMEEEHPNFLVVTKACDFRVYFGGECYKETSKSDTEVHIVENNWRRRDAGVRIRTALGLSRVPLRELRPLQEVADVCRYAQSPTHPYFGLCIERGRPPKLYKALADPSLRPVDRCCSLAAVLPQLARRHNTAEFQQFLINVASTVFQLVNTPWLPLALDKTCVVFPRSNKPSGSFANLDLFHLYLRVEFGRNADPNGQNKLSTRSILARLAILLMEIYLGEPLDQVNEVTGRGEDVPKHYLADKIYKDHFAMFSFEFAQVIDACLKGCTGRLLQGDEGEHPPAIGGRYVVGSGKAELVQLMGFMSPVVV